MSAGLSKSERLCGVKSIGELISGGSYINAAPLRCCFLKQTEEGLPNRIMVSVPKRNFKRAVRRNLLKRRIREAYRLQKDSIAGAGFDISFVYVSKEIHSFDEIFAAVGKLLKQIS